MTRRILLGLAGLVLALPLSAAAQEGAPDVRAQITKIDKAWEAAYNAGDAATLAALYTPDAKVMAPGREAVTGRAAIQALFAEEIAQGVKNSLTTGEVLGGGNLAVAMGGFTATGADGKHLDHGKYMTTYKKIDGAWHIYSDIWNSSMTP